MTDSRTIRWPLMGAILGGAVTIGILFLGSLIPPGESGGGFIFILPLAAAMLPTWGIFKVCGIKWMMTDASAPASIFVTAMIVNALLGYALAVAIRRGLRKLRKHENDGTTVK